MTMKTLSRRKHGRDFFSRLLVVLLLVFAIGLSPSAFAILPRAPLYVSLIDHLPPPNDTTLVGLDETQRGAAFQAALQAAAQNGELPPVSVVEDDAGVPPGATRVRVYLKRWSNERHAGFTETDIFCRFYAEVVRDGRTVVRLGPYTGATNFDPMVMTAVEHRRVVFQQAAKRAIDEMAGALFRVGQESGAGKNRLPWTAQDEKDSR